MYHFFTAKVGELTKGKGRRALAFLQLEPEQQQDAKPRLKAALVVGARTKGESRGQLLPQGKEAFVAHLVLDIGFVLRLKPGHRLRVEWESRGDGRIMTNILATSGEK